jgi:hypothetical protein
MSKIDQVKIPVIVARNIKLTKVKEMEDAYAPHNIEVGREVTGAFIIPPTVGEAFWVGNHWRTSTVKEVLPEQTFRTLNSVYKYEFID